MKNRKNIVSLLVVLILMVSTVALFTGCDHIYKQKLVGVWEVKKLTADGNSMEFPLEAMGSKTHNYVYFTADGKYGRAVKVTASLVPAAEGLFKADDEVDYAIKGDKISIKNGSEKITFELKGKKLTLTGKFDGENSIVQAEKTNSPSLDEIKNAKKPTIPMP